jgi:hypothetical protein
VRFRADRCRSVLLTAVENGGAGAARDVQDPPAAQLIYLQREHLEVLSQRAAEECDAPELEPVLGSGLASAHAPASFVNAKSL